MKLIFTLDSLDDEGYLHIVSFGKVHINNFREVMVSNTAMGLSTIKHICSGTFKEGDEVNVIYDDNGNLLLRADSTAIIQPIKYKSFSYGKLKIISEAIYRIGVEDKILSDEQGKHINRFKEKFEELLTNI